MQTRRMSLLEASLNTATGFFISFLANFIVLPWFGHRVSIADSFWITAIFTTLSIARSYAWRRFMNWWQYVRGVPVQEAIAQMLESDATVYVDRKGRAHIVNPLQNKAREMQKWYRY